MDPQSEIKKKIDLVEFINQRVPLKKAGRNFNAPCPFHSEKTASFVVSPERQIWHCFGACSEGGDIFKFLMKWENLTFGEAIRQLAKQAGVELKKDSFADQQWSMKQKFYTINQHAADFYQYLLEKHALGEKARQYVKSRKVNDKTTKHFYLGYAPKSWDSLGKFLAKKGYSPEEINLAGLNVRASSGRYYDRFRERLMFPLTDMQGNILGFSGRVLSKGSTDMKYMNTPETLVYHKRENLFGLHQAAKEIKTKNEVILVEGEFDAILSHQFGYKNTVAIKGSALTEDHLHLLKRLTNRILFALDMDAAGQDAIKRSIIEAEKFEFEMQVLSLKDSKDPADTLSEHPEVYEESYKQKKTIYEFLINSKAKEVDLDTIYGKKALIEATLPYLNKIFNPILEEYYLKLLATRTGIETTTIKRMLWDTKHPTKPNKTKTSNKTLTIKERRRIEDTFENYLVALFIQTGEQQHLLHEALILNENDFFNPATFKLLKFARSITAESSETLLKTLGEKLPQELLDTFNKGYLWELPAGEVDWKREIHKSILNIKKYSLKRTVQSLMTGDDETALKEKLKELSEVEKSLALG